MALAQIEEGSRVLEIGPGTGRLSVALAQRGASLVAVELGTRLAELARRKLARFDHVEVVAADFDRWTTSPQSFDAVVAATSFHWLDPTSRAAKCASLLRPGGSLAIVETHWGVALGDDPFFAASQTCYARWTPGHDPALRQTRPEDVRPACEDLPATAFTDVVHRRYFSAREYSTAAYGDLLRTMSDVLILEEPCRSGFLACMSDLIEARFGGTITRNDLYDLCVARRAA